MIGLLTGTVSHGLVVTSCGVGYEVSCPFDLPDGEQVTLFIHQITSDSGSTLYGFNDPTDRDLFVALLKVPGVAGKTALSLLRDVGPGPVVAAVASGDRKPLTAATGVGPKLADKLLAMADLEAFSGLASSAGSPVAREVAAALASLGYPSSSATVASEVAADNPDLSADQLLKVALARLRAA